MPVCFPSAHPSFSQRLIDSSGESHKLSRGAEELLNPFLVASIFKLLGTHILKTSQHFSLYIPFTPTHDKLLEIVECLYLMTEMYKIALVL